MSGPWKVHDLLLLHYYIGTLLPCKYSNINKFNDQLEHIDFQHIVKSMSPDEAFSDFFKLYKTAFDSSFPLRELRSNNKIKREPWFTTGLQKERENYLSKTRHENTILPNFS